MSGTQEGEGLVCPLPQDDYDAVLMAHGGGGRLTQRLLESLFLPAFDNPALAARHDGAVLGAGDARIALTTDGYVVRPLFFPGGDIGRLAVCGTVNDLAMCGARAAGLAAAFILEEGVEMATVRRVTESMRASAAECGVQVVTGDTKVIERGRGDGLYVTTTGVGRVPAGIDIGPGRVRPGDAVVVSGDVGRHGIAVMACREGLEFETAIESDVAPVHATVQALLEAGLDVHCLRDLTRGGLGAALAEIASAAGCAVTVEEAAVPAAGQVRAACELLGLDPLFVASEGRFIAVVPGAQAERCVQVLRAANDGAADVARIDDGPAGRVTLRTAVGARRLLDLPSGEQLPRIC